MSDKWCIETGSTRVRRNGSLIAAIMLG